MRKCWAVKFVICGLIANAFLVAIAYIPLFVVKTSVVPYAKGFDPADTTIALTVKPSSISSEWATVGAASLVAVIIAATELSIAFWRQQALKHASKQPESVAPTSKGNSKHSQPPYTRKQLWLDTLFVIWLLMILLNVGIGINGTVTNLGKVFAARPRPHFLHQCRPDYTVLSPNDFGPECSKCGSYSNQGPSWPLCPSCPFIDSSTAKNVCKMANPKKVDDMWKSFPSGHASYSVYSCVFLASYLYFRMRESCLISRYLVGLQPLAIFASLLFGIVCSLSRVADHKHRLDDVIAGAILGSSVALLLCFTIVKPLLQPLRKQTLFYCNADNAAANSRRETATDENAVAAVDLI